MGDCRQRREKKTSEASFGGPEKGPILCLCVSYFFIASSTATATATVAPTMGLLPVATAFIYRRLVTQDGAESVGKGIAQQYSNVLQVGNNIGQRPEVAETEVILCFTAKKRRCVATLDEWITIYIHNFYRQIVC